MLDEIVSNLTESQWRLPTPSPGWTVADQIGHLAYFDATAALAITDPDGFADHVEQLMAASSSADPTLDDARAMSPTELLSYWRDCRADLRAAAETLDDSTRVDWYGPSMGAKSFLTARLMECWAHGTDIADTVGASLEATDRVRHIAQLGFITRNWTYINRRIDMPAGDVRVTVTAPSGEEWTWGPDDATSTVTGTAVDFALVTSQRRNVADTALVVVGEAAIDWMSKAQLFAGPPTDPPPPR